MMTIGLPTMMSLVLCSQNLTKGAAKVCFVKHLVFCFVDVLLVHKQVGYKIYTM